MMPNEDSNQIRIERTDIYCSSLDFFLNLRRKNNMDNKPNSVCLFSFLLPTDGVTHFLRATVTFLSLSENINNNSNAIARVHNVEIVRGKKSTIVQRHDLEAKMIYGLLKIENSRSKGFKGTVAALKRYSCILESEYGSNQLALKIPALQMNRSYLTTVRR